jgi:hypothetical protein
MPIKPRDVFFLSRIGGLSNKQISKHLGDCGEDRGGPDDAGARLLRGPAAPLI